LSLKKRTQEEIYGLTLTAQSVSHVKDLAQRFYNHIDRETSFVGLGSTRRDI